MPLEAPSKEDILNKTGYIAEETGFIEGQSEWLENDLLYLIQSPLAVQLRTILGSESADSFLHPKIEDKKLMKPDARILIAKRQGNLDARELWNSLRASSKNKLMHSGLAMHLKKQELQTLQDSNALRSIHFSRHRADLMHRVSQMNRKRTKEMLKNFFLPSFDDDFSDLVQNKAISPGLIQASKESDGWKAAYEERQSQEHAEKNDPRLKFVSEDSCRFPGQFRERLEDLGVTIKTGISLGDKSAKSTKNFSIKRGISDTSSSNKLLKTAEDEAKDLYDRLSNILFEKQRSLDCITAEKESGKDSREQTWQPLTLDALIQQGKRSIDVTSRHNWYTM